MSLLGRVGLVGLLACGVIGLGSSALHILVSEQAASVGLGIGAVVGAIGGAALLLDCLFRR